MRLWHLAGYVALQTTGSFICCQSYAAEPSKPIQECDLDFQSREATLRLEGINAARFFHECWWHSRSGFPTELSSIDARKRAQRIARDPAANRPRTVDKKGAGGETADQRRAASASDRNRQLSEARFRRRTNRIIAMHARKPIFAANAIRHEAKRVNLAGTRDRSRILRIRVERLAALSRRYDERHERYALRRVRPDNMPSEPRTEASVDIPAGAIDGRRSWIGLNTGAGSKRIPAVLVGTIQKNAFKGMALHCWEQDVLFLARPKHWQKSFVCDDEKENNAPKIWFEQYEASR